MNYLITDAGMRPEPQTPTFTPYNPTDHTPHNLQALDLPNTTDPYSLQAHLPHIQQIRIYFPKFSDGRGYTLARQLRVLGYQGILRAAGELLPDQYAIARQVGFDEIQISAERANRQPAAQWQTRHDWAQHDYQARLAGR